MRFLLIILLFLSQLANGQIINASQPYRPFVVAQTFLLDQFPGAAAAYSLRRLNSSYTGALIRCRRSSDNTESDINADANGNLDTVALKNFVGANNGFIVTWYDQSGNTRNATQSTASEQPAIVSSGNILRENTFPAIFFGSAGPFWLEHSLSSALSQPGTVFGVAKYTNNSATVLLGSNNNSTRWQMFKSGSSPFRISIFSGTTLNSGSSSQVLVLQYALFNGASSVVGVNGSTTTGNAGTTTTSSIRIGRDAASTNFNLGYASELIIYQSNQASNRTAIEANINTYYVIY